MREVEDMTKRFYDDAMTTHIDVAELGPKWESLVDDLAENGGEISLTRDGKAIAKVVRLDHALTVEKPSAEGLDEEWKANTLNEWKRAIDDLIHGGGTANTPPMEGLVLYKGEWMIPAAAERERSIEHLRGSGKILGDIVSPIDDLEWDTLK